MIYVLTREGAPDDPRLALVHTPEEVVSPAWADGVWTARCRTGSASTALQARRYGFALQEEIVEDRDFATPVYPPRHLTAAEVLQAHGFAVHDGEPVLGPRPCPEADWRAWGARGRTPLTAVDPGDLRARLRAPIDPDVLERAGQVARAGAWADPKGEDVAIVKVLHGWGDREKGAIVSALDAATALGPRSRVIAVQNQEAAQTAFGSWSPRAGGPRFTRVPTANDGFAAACNAGARAAPRARWYLFTQPDALWGPEAVRDAIGVARALALPPAGFGAPALVGPSGGYVDDYRQGGIREFGRNVARHRGLAPTAVDWLAGYWLLVDGEVFRKAGGWCEDFFLYFEDPDFSLRCALGGARPIAWPGLAVEHERGGTIRSLVSDAVVSEMQGESRRTFGARWGGR
jgi:hypothetical protein